MTIKTLSGGCSCGRISYQSTAAPLHLDFCYCRICQQLSGSAFAAWMGTDRDSLTWSGERPATYQVPIGDTNVCVSERSFCSACGSHLSIQYHLYPGKTHIAAGTLRHTDFGLPPVGCHIWCRYVPSWYRIPNDGVERYEEFDEVFQQKLEQYLKGTQHA